MNCQSGIARPLLYQEVIAALYQMIDRDQIPPGGKLPSERDLMERLSVSRNVLREAFHVLELRGVIISRQGKGRFLRSLPQSLPLDGGQGGQIAKSLERRSLLEAYEVRQVLEVKAVELIIRNASARDLEDLEAAYEKMLERFRQTGITAGEFELHRLYAQKTGSLFMEQTLNSVLSSILDMMHTTFYDVMATHQTQREAQQHREILDAIQAGNVDWAKRAMYDHLQESIDLL